MRKFLNQYGAYVAIVLLVLSGLLIYALNHRSAVKLPDKGFYVDDETGEETIRPLTDVPPIVGKGGKPTIVREYKYSCDGGSTAKVAYYFKFQPETQAKLQGMSAEALSNFDSSNGELVRLPDKGSAWVAFKSQEGQSVITNISCPKGQDISTVVP